MNDTEQDSKADKPSYAGRATLNFAQFMGNKDMVLHVGLAGQDNEFNITPTNSSGSGGLTTQGTFLSYRTPGRGLANIFRAQIGGQIQPGTSGASAGLGEPSNATSQIKSRALGLEGILAYNNFKLQGEYATADFRANSGGGTIGLSNKEAYSLDTQAFYAEALWLVTGEKYANAYKGGAFSSIKPTNDFDPENGQWGAWELGLKYEQYEVDNMVAGTTGGTTTVTGTRAQGTLSCATTGTQIMTTAAPAQINGCESKSKTYTAGIKWILNPNARVLANYSRTNFGNKWEHFDLDDLKYMDHEDLVMVRTQFAF
jgi:phosphate-selective porin OprO/OprP